MIATLGMLAGIVSLSWRSLMAEWDPISPGMLPTVRRESVIYCGLATALTIGAILVALRAIRRSQAVQMSTYTAEALVLILTGHLGWILLLINMYFLM